MTIGALRIDLSIPEANSLKDRRRLVESLKQRIRQRFGASVAEVGHADTIRRCVLGVAVVSGSSRVAESELDKILAMVHSLAGLVVLEVERELL